jgi:hypothetical protein
MAKIVKSEVLNFKGVIRFTLEPTSNVVHIVGKNRAGKTSAMDAVACAIGGEKFSPPDPIRKGEKSALSRHQLDNGYVVERKWTRLSDGRVDSKLYVRDEKGIEIKKPQGFLDALLPREMIDPMWFDRAKPKERADALLSIAEVKFDFAKSATERQSAYDQRTEIAREMKATKALVEAGGSLPPAGQLVDVDELLRRQESVADEQRERGRVLATVDKAKAGRNRAEDRVGRARAEIARAEQELKDSLKDLWEWVEAERRANAEATLLGPDLTGKSMREEIQAAQRTNEEVRARQRAIAEHAKQLELLSRLEADHKAQDTKIDAIDHGREIALAQAKYPMPGLGFMPSGEGVQFNGLPYEQASGRERISICMSIAAASHPEFRVVLVRDASLFDADGLAWVEQFAVENDLSVWLEEISHTGAGQVLTLVEGSVADA